MEPKVVLITGCSSGIGMATASVLAQDPGKKYIVYATMRNLGKKGNLEKEAANALNETLYIREVDVTKEDTIVKVVGELKEKYGRIDVLINNAGIANYMILELTDMQEIRDIMEVNFFGVLRMTQEVLPVMKQRQSGRIVNISSEAGIYGVPNCQAYTCSKFALEGLTESLSIELRSHDIWVSSIQPGPVQTAMKDNIILHEELLQDERVDEKTKKPFEFLQQTFKKAFLTEDIHPSEDMAILIRSIIEEEKPHLRYRFAMDGRPWATTKYKDEHGDDFVDVIHQFIQNI